MTVESIKTLIIFKIMGFYYNYLFGLQRES